MYSKTAGRDHEIAQWGTTLVVQSGFNGSNTFDPYRVRNLFLQVLLGPPNMQYNKQMLTYMCIYIYTHPYKIKIL